MDFALPALPELEEIADVSAASCFRRLAVTEHMSLLPSFIGHLGEGIVQQLNRRILRYRQGYGGVLLAYSKPTVLQCMGRIHDEQPHIHFDVKYDAYVFKPIVGSILVGTVNKIGGDHIGCLVYDCFNAAVASNRVAGRDRGWLSRRFVEGESVWFRVATLDVVGGVLSVKGAYVDLDSIGVYAGSSEPEVTLHCKAIISRLLVPHLRLHRFLLSQKFFFLLSSMLDYSKVCH